MATDKEKPNVATLARTEYCTGCGRQGVCPTRHDQAELNKLSTRRACTNEKYFVCNTLFNVREFVERPPNDKETRRLYGEAGIHY